MIIETIPNFTAPAAKLRKVSEPGHCYDGNLPAINETGL